MEDLLRKFSRPGNVMMDYSAGTRSRAKACMLLNEPRRLVTRVLELELLAAAEADLTLVLHSQGRTWKCDISGRTEMIAAAKSIKDERAAILASNRASV